MGRRWTLLPALVGAILTGCAALASGARAEVKEVRVSKGYGILYLPLIVLEERKLFEKQAAEAGLGDIKVRWSILDGGNVINDAMLAGSLDMAGIGAPGFITLWAKARGIPSAEVVGISGLSTTSLWLNTNRPEIKTLRDFKPTDKIALPGIKTSLSAVVLQMIVAKEFGRENYTKLDPLTVGLAHPEGLVALTGGKTEITAHFTSPPFSYIELKNPAIHRVASSAEVIGDLTLDVTFARKRFADANPGLVKAFLAALDQANALIASDKAQAADIFVKSSKTKISVDEVMEILNDKDTQFSTTPRKIMEFVDFMHGAGSIKARPAAWTDLFVAPLHGKGGS